MYAEGKVFVKTEGVKKWLKDTLIVILTWAFENVYEKTCLCHMQKTKVQMSRASVQSDQHLLDSIIPRLDNS